MTETYAMLYAALFTQNWAVEIISAAAWILFGAYLGYITSVLVTLHRETKALRARTLEMRKREQAWKVKYDEGEWRIEK